MATFAQGTASRRPATDQDETEDEYHERCRGRQVAGPDTIDEMIEVHGGRLHVRADCTDWIKVADAGTVLNGHPIRFATIGRRPCHSCGAPHRP